jgi:LysM repeat protein
VKRLLLIGGLVLAGGDVRAQSASDLPTTETQSSSQAGLPTTPTQEEPPPSAGPHAYYPGMPVPQPPAEEGAAGSAKAGGGKEAAPNGLILNNDDRPIESDGSAAATGETPDTHVVRKGDTLWDLSARYYGNAWGWPKMWSYNPQITNPHWIYPGDVVRILPPGGGPAPAAVHPTPGPAAPVFTRARPSNGIFLRQTGFIEPGELARAGKIVGSKEEKLMLGTLDEAYVQFKKERPFQVGERYIVYRPMREVHHPVTGKLLGHMVEILGEGEVRAVTNGRIARVGLVDSVNPIERGDLVGPLRRQFKVVHPVADKSDLQGVIVATLQPLELVGADTIVFVDRGKQDGVELGNRFLVTRRGDGYQPILSSGPMDDRRYPRETIGQIIVVDLRDHVATGYMTRSAVEARIGDRVEAHRGF